MSQKEKKDVRTAFADETMEMQGLDAPKLRRTKSDTTSSRNLGGVEEKKVKRRVTFHGDISVVRPESLSTKDPNLMFNTRGRAMTLRNLMVLARRQTSHNSSCPPNTPEALEDDTVDALALKRCQSQNTFVRAYATSDKKDHDHVFGDMGYKKEGLTHEEAAKKLETEGKNELPRDPPPTVWEMAYDQLSDPLVIMLIVATIVSLALGDYAAGTVILLIVILITALGVIQEGKAESALRALEAIAKNVTTVIRSGAKIVNFPITDLVTGDLVLIRNTETVPADCLIMDGFKVSSNEALLTGESEPIKKSTDLDIDAEEPRRTVFLPMGAVIEGECQALVIATGANTTMAQDASLVANAGLGKTALQEKLTKLGVVLGIISTFAGLTIFLVGWLTGVEVEEDSDQPLVLDWLLVGVAMIVAAVPEGLPACVAATLAMGMRRLVTKNVIVRKLKAVVVLGMAKIINSDKTGTMSVGIMTVVRMFLSTGKVLSFTGVGYNPEGTIEVDTDEKEERDVIMALRVASMCNKAELHFDEEKKEWIATGNLTDKAFKVAPLKFRAPDAIVEGFRIVHVNDFKSSRGCMSVIVENVKTGKTYSLVKGSAEDMFEKCTSYVSGFAGDGDAYETFVAHEFDEESKRCQKELFNMEAAKGQREIVCAMKPIELGGEEQDDVPIEFFPEIAEAGLIYLGLTSLIDPLKPEVKRTVQQAKQAHVQIRMITGDCPETAKTLAEEAGLFTHPEKVMVLSRDMLPREDEKEEEKLPELRNTILSLPNDTEIVMDCAILRFFVNLDDEEVIEKLVYCFRVASKAKPVDKLTIVETQQKVFGWIVAMTGDGVNDAPSLKQADLGAAMGSGTQNAKDASDMIITDDNLSTLVDAIWEGRRLYANIQKFIHFLMSTNNAEVFLLLVVVLMGIAPPLATITLLWLNLMTDSLPALALAAQPLEEFEMQLPPRPRNESIITRYMWAAFVAHGLVLLGVCIAVFLVGLDWHTGSWDGSGDGTERARTMVAYVIVFGELLRAFGASSLRQSFFTVGVWSNKYLWYSVGGAIVLTMFVGNTPEIKEVFNFEDLDGRDWGLVLGMSLVPFLMEEIWKWVVRTWHLFPHQEMKQIEPRPYTPLLGVVVQRLDTADRLMKDSV